MNLNVKLKSKIKNQNNKLINGRYKDVDIAIFERFLARKTQCPQLWGATEENSIRFCKGARQAWFQSISRSSRRRCPIKKGALRNFSKFTRKHLRQSLFINKVAGLTVFAEHVRTTASALGC